MKNNIMKVNNEDPYVLDSREVAEMMGKRHGDLMIDINGRKDGKGIGIKQVLLKGNFPLSEYFIESQYKDNSGKSNNMYWISKKGCELLGNKLQGEKGILYSVKYVEKFNEMENKIKNNIPDSYLIQDPIERAKAWIKEQEDKKLIELENKKLATEIVYKEDVIIGLVDDIDLSEKRQRLNQIIRKGDKGKISNRWGLLYEEFNKKYHVDIKRRMKSKETLEMKPKIKSKLDYIDRVMNKIPELYELACKIFENDVEKLKKEWFENVNR